MFYIRLIIKNLQDWKQYLQYLFAKEKPDFAATQVQGLQKADTAQSVVRVNSRHIGNEDPKRFTRAQLVRITNQDNGKSVCRFVLGAGSGYRLAKNTVAVDYDTKLALGLINNYAPEEGANLHIRPASPNEKKVFYCFEHHSSSERLANANGYRGLWISYISLLLGMLSLL